MRRRKKKFSWVKVILVLVPLAIITPLIAQAIPSGIELIGQPKVEDSKKAEVPPTIKVVDTPESKKPLVVENKSQPTPTPTPPALPTPNPSYEPILSCVVSDNRPVSSKLVYVNKPVAEGERYTADVFERINPKNFNSTRLFYYILHEKLTPDSKPITIANFSIIYSKINPKSKVWNVEFNSCGLDPKIDLTRVIPIEQDVVSDNKAPMLMVYGDNDYQLLKTTKLTGYHKQEKIGQVIRPKIAVRILSPLDITEEK